MMNYNEKIFRIFRSRNPIFPSTKVKFEGPIKTKDFTAKAAASKSEEATRLQS
jgi:hypothetical protein